MDETPQVVDGILHPRVQEAMDRWMDTGQALMKERANYSHSTGSRAALDAAEQAQADAAAEVDRVIRATRDDRGWVAEVEAASDRASTVWKRLGPNGTTTQLERLEEMDALHGIGWDTGHIDADLPKYQRAHHYVLHGILVDDHGDD